MIRLKKQALLILYSVISIVFGLIFAIDLNAFEFLIPISLANMLTVYFVCYMDNKVNFQGMVIYLVVLLVTFLVMFSIPYQYNFDTLRFVCMKSLSVMFFILGGLAGGLLRREIYQIEKKKEMEDDTYGGK